jgi:hypothetical protein
MKGDAVAAVAVIVEADAREADSISRLERTAHRH